MKGMGSNYRHRPSGELSPRDLQVVRLAAQGLTTAEIAERLLVSPHTVTTHHQRVYERVGRHSRAALVRHGERAGWRAPGDSNA